DTAMERSRALPSAAGTCQRDFTCVLVPTYVGPRARVPACWPTAGAPPLRHLPEVTLEKNLRLACRSKREQHSREPLPASFGALGRRRRAFLPNGGRMVGVPQADSTQPRTPHHRSTP